MQALGSYHGGRMLFLGLGTGLGSTLVWDTTSCRSSWVICLTTDGTMIEDLLGKRGLDRLGKKIWHARSGSRPCGGSSAPSSPTTSCSVAGMRKFATMPGGAEPGNNRNAYLGGRRCGNGPRTNRPKWNVI